jgi:hypothetical protein
MESSISIEKSHIEEITHLDLQPIDSFFNIDEHIVLHLYDFFLSLQKTFIGRGHGIKCWGWIVVVIIVVVRATD